jgi:hypothetical protein
MRKIFSILCATALLMLCIMVYPVQAQAAEVVESGTCGENLTWIFDDAGTLTISGNGLMVDLSWGRTPWFDYSEEIFAIEVVLFLAVQPSLVQCLLFEPFADKVAFLSVVYEEE